MKVRITLEAETMPGVTLVFLVSRLQWALINGKDLHEIAHSFELMGAQVLAGSEPEQKPEPKPEYWGPG